MDKQNLILEHSLTYLISSKKYFVGRSLHSLVENIFAFSTTYYFLFLTADESSLQLLLVIVIATIIKTLVIVIVMGLGTRLRVIHKVRILGLWQQTVTKP